MLPDPLDEPQIADLIERYKEGDPEATVLLERYLTSVEKSQVTQSVRHVETSLLFTDIVDSSYMFECLGDQYGRAVLTVHDDIVTRIAEERGGTVIKHTGDGIMVSFASCGRSVKAAMLIQEKIAEHNERYPLLQMQLRIGVNVGGVLEENNDIFGASVNLAARVCDLAGSDKIFTTGIVYERCKDKGYCFAFRGRYEVKGFSKEIPVYEVLWQV